MYLIESSLSNLSYQNKLIMSKNNQLYTQGTHLECVP